MAEWSEDSAAETRGVASLPVRAGVLGWLYVYCILEGCDLPAGAHRGLEGASVRAVAYRDICAAVSTLSHPAVPVNRDNLLTHERLVEELMDERAVLPVRFGTVLRDAASLKLTLSQGYGSFLDDLDLVRGKVELGLRVLAPRESPEVEDGPVHSWPPSSPGTRYLMERIRQQARARAVRERLERWAGPIDDRLRRHAQDRRMASEASESTVMNAAYLVWRHEVPAFKREVELQGESFPELRFLLTGPWPAYSFVSCGQESVGQGLVPCRPAVVIA